MTKNTFPVSKAVPLIAIPANIPQIGFLGGDEGEEINDSIRKDYKKFDVLQVGKYKDGIIKGSNPFYGVAVQNRLPSNYRVASQADVESAMGVGVFDFRGTYEDTGLVLRTEGEPNSYLARHLMTQVKGRGFNKMPVMIPLNGLELVEDKNSNHGLSFKLKENAEVIYAPILNKGGNFSNEDIDAKTGLPSKLGNGNRTLYTRDSGLSRLCLGGILNLGSYDDYLANSNDSSRVVLVSTGEAGSQNFLNERLAELQTEEDARIAEIKSLYAQAKELVKGKK
ncbi:MAG: hypothetical protein AABW51_04160 [Nanoarchaeota archaeon]